MADKKKVLGKGKNKQNPYIKKLELPKYSNDSLNSDESSIKKFKSPKVNILHSNSDIGRKYSSYSPSSLPKRNFFNKRTSETPKFYKTNDESQRKSMPNISERNEANDLYVRSLSGKVTKYKQRNCELEEEIKEMEVRFKLEQGNLHEEIDSLNTELKRVKSDFSEQEVSLNREILRLRTEAEENKLSFKLFISQISGIIESTPADTLKEEIGALVSEASAKLDCEVSQESTNESPDLPSNYTGSFKNINYEVHSPREIVKSPNTQAIVLHNYNPSSHGELKLVSGDRITILNFDESNGWWLGRIGDKIGMFPRNCVMFD